MVTKVELHQLIDLSVDIHEGRSNVNFTYLNRILHELVKHLGIGDSTVLITDSPETPKQTISIPQLLTSPVPETDGDDTGVKTEIPETSGEEIVIQEPASAEDVSIKLETELSQPRERGFSTTSGKSDLEVLPPLKSDLSVASDQTKRFSDMQLKMDQLERKLSTLDDLVPEDKKEHHKESMVGDMWNFINLSKRTDGCESSLEMHSKLLDELRNGLKELKSYKFYWDQLKNNPTNDLRTMIDGLVSDMGEKSKEIRDLKDKVKSLENAKPDEALAKELAEKVEGLMKLKDEIDDKIAGLPKMEDIHNIYDNYVTWMGLDEILRNYKPPRTPVPPSREGIEALNRADELGQKTDDMSSKLSGLEAEVKTKIGADDVDARISEAFKQKRPPSSRAEAARIRFTEHLQDLQDRIAALEDEFGGKSLPDDLKIQLEQLQIGLKDALDAASMMNRISEENQTNKSAIAELNGTIEDLIDRYKILQESVENVPEPTAEIDSAVLKELQDTIDALKAEQEAHHDEINKLSEDSNSKDLHLKTLYSGIDDLREMKADKDFVALEMEEKADKRLVDHKANRVFVDNHFEKLNDGLQAALQRCEGQEEALKNAIHQISNDVDGKLDRMELQSVKDFLENRLSKLKNAAPTAPPPRQDDSDAAGMRRRLLKFHCISCDRPVEVNPGGMLPTSLPAGYGLPGGRSNRPYTTYELELIRQHQRNLLHMKPSDPYDMPATNRSCGGQHTMTYAHRRTRISALSQFFREDEPLAPVPVPLRETEIQGQDGHIYRGSLQQKFPVLPRVGQTVYSADDLKALYRLRQRENSVHRPKTAPRT